MGTHESSVNFQGLINDLADMYPYDVTDVVLIEIIANALDAKATRISIGYDASSKILTVTDNGEGMDANQFNEYHDFAAGLKTRGMGIGFAGVGAKISFNVADKVLTETQSESFSGGSNWYLQSKKRLVWDDIEPSHLSGNGTRVEVHFRADTKPSYNTSEDFVRRLRLYYLPLLDKNFLDLYERMGYYSADLKFIINGKVIEPVEVVKELALDKVKEFIPARSGKKIGYGLLGLAAQEYPLAPNMCGILLCTHGKVIKADLFNQFPGDIGPKILGFVEIPGFINFLTTAKTDFTHPRGKYKEFEALYDPIRQEFKTWLAELGIQSMEQKKDVNEALKLEQELKKLVEDIPELGEFFGFRNKKPILQQAINGSIDADLQEGAEVTLPFGEGQKGEGPAPVDVGEEDGSALTENKEKGEHKGEPITRTAKRGPKIDFVSAPERVDLAWIEGNYVIINSGHPSYAKVKADSTARRTHSLFAIGTAVQEFMAKQGGTIDTKFIARLMQAWGKR